MECHEFYNSRFWQDLFNIMTLAISTEQDRTNQHEIAPHPSPETVEPAKKRTRAPGRRLTKPVGGRVSVFFGLGSRDVPLAIGQQSVHVDLVYLWSDRQRS